ncbi:MAG: TatD family hydrolase [Candidatus Nanopelagicales bacterium]
MPDCAAEQGAEGVPTVPEGRPALPAALPQPVIDAHTHWDSTMRGEQLPTPAQALALAQAVNVVGAVQVGCDLESARWSVAAAAATPGLVAAIGIHPNDAARMVQAHGQAALDEALAEIAELASDPCVRGIGETGLDFYRTGPQGRPVQEAAFAWHIDLAVRLSKTLVIHDRQAHDEILAVLAAAPELPPVIQFHCFSGDAELAQFCADQGWYLSFPGVVTFASAPDLQEAARVVPRDLILVETDAPYLAAVPNRGKPNASYLIPHTVRFLAELRGEPLEQLCDDLYANAQRAFGPFGA